MKNVVVTGAGGYIGRHVVKVLCDRGYQVKAVDVIEKDWDSRAEFCPVRIFSGEEDIYQQLGAPDILIHLAWRDGFVHNSEAHMGDLSNHIRFLSHMIQAGLPMLTVMGSMHEIGYWEGAIDENTPCRPMSQYGIAKNAMRESLMLLVQNSKCVLHWLRGYYITGDDLRASNIFSKIAKAAKEGKHVFPFTTGKNKYDFIDVDDLAEMIVAASVQKEIAGIINVCSGVPMSLAERVEKFISDHHFDIALEYGAFPDRAYDSPGEWGDATKIKRIMEKDRTRK